MRENQLDGQVMSLDTQSTVMISRQFRGRHFVMMKKHRLCQNNHC